MKPFRNRDGLTLVELLVTIAIGSIVTLAATTVLLLGLRINRQSTDTVTHQNTTRIILSTLEDMASEAKIGKLITGPDTWSWYICGEELESDDGEIKTIKDSVLIGYDEESNQICTGGTVTTTITTTTGDKAKDIQTVTYAYTKGTPILEGVYASYATLDDNNLLTFSVQTEEGNYTTSVYCRMAPKLSEKDTVIGGIEENASGTVDSIMGSYEGSEGQTNGVNTTKARAEFLKLATSQRGSPGLIFVNGYSTGEYYSEWYIGSGWQQNGWNKDTPWCACFVVWALDAVERNDKLNTKISEDRNTHGLADVDNFIAYLKDACRGKTNDNDASENLKCWYDNAYTPIPGDLIFFDWEQDDDADHVGAVLSVDRNYIYTIEGNSADMVAVRRYTKDDPRIMGYGVLDWVENPQ